MRNKNLIMGFFLALLMGCNSPSSSTKTTGTATEGVTQTGTTATVYTHFVYVADGFEILEFGSDPQTGQMEWLVGGAGNGGSNAFISIQIQTSVDVVVANMIISPNGKWLYALNSVSNGFQGIAQMNIDSTTGLLSKIGTGFIGEQEATNGPIEFAVSADSKTLYTANGFFEIQSYSINQTTGALTAGTGYLESFSNQAQEDAWTTSMGLTWVTGATAITSTTSNGNTYEISNGDRVDLVQNSQLTSYSVFTNATSIVSK